MEAFSSAADQGDAVGGQQQDHDDGPFYPATPELFAAAAALWWAHTWRGAAGSSPVRTDPPPDATDQVPPPPPPPPLYPMLLYHAWVDPTAAYNEATTPEQVPDDVIPHAAGFLRTSMRRLRFRGALLLRLVLSRESEKREPPAIDAVMASEAPLRLAAFLDASFDYDPRLQFEAACALTSVASSVSDHAIHVAHLSGFVTNLVRLIRSPDAPLSEQCASSLALIACGRPQLRDLLLDRGAGSAVADSIMSSQTAEQASCLPSRVWAAGALCRGSPPPRLDNVLCFVSVLAPLVAHHHREVAVDALWGLSDLTERDAIKDALLRIDGALPRVFAAMQVGADELLTPALRIAGNFCSGGKEYTRAATELGLMEAMPTLLSHSKKEIRKEAAWTLSNILADDRKYIGLMLNLDVFPHVIRAAHAREVAVRHEAMWCIANAAMDATPVDMQGILSAGVVPCLCHSLRRDAKTTCVALTAIGELLKKAADDVRAPVKGWGGVDAMESLKAHPNPELASKAQELLANYFDES